MTPRRRAACMACQGSRDPIWIRSGVAARRVASISKMSPSKARSPITKARASPISPGAQSSRRTASGERTCTMSPRAGPSAVPSQNSKRTGGTPPKKWARRGAAAAAAPRPGSVPTDGGCSRPGRIGRGLEMMSDRIAVS